MTMRSGSENGRSRSRTAFTTLKIAVFAPIPSASAQIATSVKPGDFRSVRNANRISFRIDTLRPSTLRILELNWRLDAALKFDRPVDGPKNHKLPADCADAANNFLVSDFALSIE